MPEPGVLQIAATAEGWVLRIEGRGSLNESPTFRETVRCALHSEPEAVAVLDLNACTYLDSTMLGCLVMLHREFSSTPEVPHFQIAASVEVRQRLLAPTRLDRHLHFCNEPPETTSEWTTLRTDLPELQEFGRHVMECHDRLAEIGGPRAEAYRQVAEQLAREIGQTAP